MLTWLLRLFGLGPKPEPAKLLDEATPQRTAPSGGSKPAYAAPSSAPRTVDDEAEDPATPPWARQVAVRAEDPSTIREHALQGLDAVGGAATSDADRAYLDRLRRLITAEQLDVPPFPEIARELDSLLREGTADILQVARVVERDPGLVRRVWALARSAQFASPPRSLHHAVSRVGLDALWRVGMRACLNDTLLRVKGFEKDAERLRALGIVTAELSAHLGDEKRGNLFMTGLMHDVGRLLVLRAAGEARASDRPSASIVAKAQDQVGAALSVLVVSSWGLDEAVAAGVGYSADVDRAPEQYARIAKVVRAASVAAQATDLARLGVEVDPALAYFELVALGFEPSQTLERANELRASVLAEAQA